MPPRFHALTVEANGPLLVLRSQCKACAAFDPKVVPPSQVPPLHAIADIAIRGRAARHVVLADPKSWIGFPARRVAAAFPVPVRLGGCSKTKHAKQEEQTQERRATAF